MDEDDILSFYFFLISLSAGLLSLQKLKKPRKKRRFAVRPLNRDKETKGHFNTLFKFIKKNDEEQFFKYTRFTTNQFALLLKILSPHLKKKRGAICPEEMLAMSLHYLASGISLQELAWNYYIGKTTAHKIVINTCEVMWTILKDYCLPVPSKENLLEISDGFYNRWNMPHCIGALDGKHVMIQKPRKSGTEFFNYKKSNSLVLMATCDAFYRFVYVDVGGFGSNHDSTIFKHSAFGEAVLSKNQSVVKFPENRHLPKTKIDAPYFLVADQAFPLNERIMRPYPGENLNLHQRIFNYRLSRARRTIENTFGILASRWLIYRKPIVANVENVEKFVKATLCLHNFIQTKELEMPVADRKYCPTGFADGVDGNGVVIPGAWRNEPNNLRNIGRVGANNASLKVKRLRNQIAEYFLSSAGSVTWQMEAIEKTW